MFIACDESMEWKRKVIGAISIIPEEAADFEKECFKLRFKHKVFGEIKWTKVVEENKFYDFYKSIIELLLSYSSVRFHSNSFKQSQFKAGYVLIRSISWKLQKLGYTGELSILFDEAGELGRQEITITSECLKNDTTVKLPIRMCHQGNSTIINLMQATDLIVGAMAYKLAIKNGQITNRCGAKLSFIEFLESFDGNMDLSLFIKGKMWNYYDKKIQNYNLG